MSVRATLYNDEPTRKMTGSVVSVRVAKSWATKNNCKRLRTELNEHEGFRLQWWIKDKRGWREITHNEFFGMEEA